MPTRLEPLVLTGYRLIRRAFLRQANTKPITGSFPPYTEYFCVGRAENYYIHEGYQHREHVPPYDDTVNADEWQLEVYQYAREICDREHLRTVCDIGCGSGYKLMKFFPDLDTIGVEVAKTCDWLKKRYPRRVWVEVNFSVVPKAAPDLVIAADVIEHIADPTALLNYIASMRPRYIVLSTPERNLMRAGTHNGPPRNLHHVREWNMTELHAYIGSYFQIKEHFISNATQSTQCVLCSPRT